EKHFVFYAHAITGGPNANAVVIAGENGTSSSLLAFGTVNVLDHPITVGPDPSSKFLGRIQGIEASSDINQNTFLHLTTVIFETGRYNGSTIEMHGANRFRQEKRDVSVVGGTGRLKYARGFATLQVVAFSGFDITFKFNATVRFY
ncbi:hypothetical protein KI387_040791, partial [Taxus chinensis]